MSRNDGNGFVPSLASGGGSAPSSNACCTVRTLAVAQHSLIWSSKPSIQTHERHVSETSKQSCSDVAAMHEAFEELSEDVRGEAAKLGTVLFCQCDKWSNGFVYVKMLAANEKQTPLRRNVTIDEVGNAGAFLCSDLASGISGEILYVDGGFNTTAMGTPHAARTPRAPTR